ncbi:hypothetical protein HPB48_017564 [Haemaphysalis longicornis]|uniref:CCHC-type domain-containing protein n=1 Tax=Haemaphysalis longicornis TaxID=44386 RepID=A0A9J6FNJ7_HAELO|nr:hypothetical protein HPB48_017564 [Haemaphysalis longicornis]
MLGMSDTATITFEGPHVPFYVRVYGTLVRCNPYRNTYQCCVRCGEVEHRSDVCPSPHQSICPQCHTPDPAPDHPFRPQCKLCGLEHLTVSKECRRKLRPPPPPAHVRIRQQTQQLRHPALSTTRRPPPLKPDFQRKPQMSWSCVAAPPPPTTADFPPLDPHQKTAPTTQLDTLIHENAQLKAQIFDNERQITLLQEQISELRTLLNTSTQHTQQSPPQTDPLASTSPLAALTSSIADLKLLFQSEFTALVVRIQALEDKATDTTKRKKQHKPGPALTPASFADAIMDDDASSTLST